MVLQKSNPRSTKPGHLRAAIAQLVGGNRVPPLRIGPKPGQTRGRWEINQELNMPARKNQNSNLRKGIYLGIM